MSDLLMPLDVIYDGILSGLIEPNLDALVPTFDGLRVLFGEVVPETDPARLQ